MNDKRMKDALENIARRGVPENTNLWPELSARLERKSLMFTLRTRPFMAILIALLILLALSGAAYALGRALGYIPGVGLVDQSAPIRVLVEPVSITRDGITITVKEAVLSADKTAILLSVENIPADKLSPDGTGSGCGIKTELKMPDDTILQMTKGWGVDDWGSGYADRFTFTPIPSHVNEATIIVPCIAGSIPGTLPENWELPLRFAPAPPDMTVVPVIEVTPSRATSEENPMTLEKIVETENSYILIGTFRSLDLPPGAQAVMFSNWPKITDANRQEVPYQFANYQVDIPNFSEESGTFSWAFEIEGKQFAWPITIAPDLVAAEYQNEQAKFEFDTGPNPQNEQIWELNIDLGQLAGYPVQVVKAIRRTDGYEFYFKSTAIFHGINVEIGNSTQASTGMDGPGEFSSAIKFDGEIPEGKLTVLVTHPIVAISGHWQLQWQPENTTTSPAALPTPTNASQTCVTVDSWKAALSNPDAIPAELNNKVLVRGRVIEDGKPASEENTGIYISRLDGSDKQEILQGHNWASLSPSPDGSQIVYDGTGYPGGSGLYILNLATGDTGLIPNTITDDMAPLWSPDGTWIAFVRFSKQDLYIIHPDGTALLKITDGTEYEQLVGWWPDGSALLYATETQNGGLLKKFDIRSNAISDLFVIAAAYGAPVSSDSSQIAFVDKNTQASYGLYVSHPDGSNRRLIAPLTDQFGALNQQWSPDGKWLLVNILDTPGMDTADSATALVNLQTCQIIPLPITGGVVSWVQ